MKTFYFFRVFVVSLEALVLCIAWLSWRYLSAELTTLAATIALNEEMLKFLMVLPVGLAVWVAKEVRHILQEDKNTTRVLVEWSDYWKLKLHVWVSLAYAAIFVCMSFAPWTVKAGLSTGFGLLLFVSSIVGQLILVTSVYAAGIKMKELLAHVPEP